MSNFDLLSMIEALGSASSLLTKPRDDWSRFIAKCSGVSLGRVRSLIDMLTYDRTIKKRDISLQPFLNLSDDFLTICPFLVYNSNLERNFLALISKKFKSDYDEKSYIFEKKMIERCSQIAKAADWKFASNRPIIGKKSMPDIDAAFYDLTSKCLLLCQLKAVIPPSEPAEVIERSEREREGIEQSILIKKLAEQSPELIWQSCFSNMKYQSPKIFHAVILQGSFGSINSLDAEIPSLELDHFDEIAKNCDSLVGLCEYIYTFSYLPKIDLDYMLTDSVIDFGKYRIIWDGFTPKKLREP
jgi:hypothetical protein